MAIEITWEDESDEVRRELKRRTVIALIKCGELAIGYAKGYTPVDTGRLRNSITYAMKDDAGKVFSYADDEGHLYDYIIGGGATDNDLYIGSNVSYAEGIETGTHRKKGAAHMLKKALANHKNQYKTAITNALKYGT